MVAYPFIPKDKPHLVNGAGWYWVFNDWQKKCSLSSWLIIVTSVNSTKTNTRP
jgi:hypothetical protein